MEAEGGAIPPCFFEVVRTIGVMFRSDPDEEIVDGKSLHIERRFTRWEHALPGLGLINEIEPSRDRQRRIDEELLQWPSPGREAPLSVNTPRPAISAPTRCRNSFRKTLFHHRVWLPFMLTVPE